MSIVGKVLKVVGGGGAGYLDKLDVHKETLRTRRISIRILSIFPKISFSVGLFILCMGCVSVIL